MGCSNSVEESSKPPTNNPISPPNTSLAGLQLPKQASATPANGATSSGVPAPTPRTVKRLSKSEVDERIVSSGTIQHKLQANIPMQFAWVSQRGFYPNALDKPNQDSYSVLANFDDNMAYFAVYDGHGVEGHTCAWFVRDNLPAAIKSELKNFPSTSAGISKALTKAHIDVNKKLHENTEISDELSGTTSISVLMVGKTMYVCNVGDSRAIILSKSASLTSGNMNSGVDVAAKLGEKQRLLASPLSSDQTPYRKDERERVMRRGARVLTQDQIDGVKPMTATFDELSLGDAIDEDGDPPRVWSTHGNYPGTAFTRSFGDSVAESIGVFAEPEILTRDLTINDQYVILASDGVFEFITNQMVSDMVALYSDNPLSACKIVVSAAYELWLQYETRTDDITIIVIYVGDREGDVVAAGILSPTSAASALQDGDAAKAAAGAGDGEKALVAPEAAKAGRPPMPESKKLSPPPGPDDVITVTKRVSGADVISEQQIQMREARPVRRGLSREKKKKVITSVSAPTLDSGSETEEAAFDPANVTRTKTDSELTIITNSLKHNFLFQKLSQDILEAVAHVMTPVNVVAGQKVIVQGDEGDKFYVVCSGTYEVKVRQPDAKPEDGDGETVATYEAGKDLHPCFGDLALMYGQPRAATVTAVADGSLWALDRNVFRAVMKKLTAVDPTRELTRALRKISILRQLNLQQIQRMIEIMTEVVVPKDDIIIRKGQPIDTLYLITAGTCQDAVVSTQQDGASPADDASVTYIPVGHKYEAYEYFGHMSLINDESSTVAYPLAHSQSSKTLQSSATTHISTQTIMAITDVKMLCISRQVFEENFGPLQEVIDIQIRRRESFSRGLPVASATSAKLDNNCLRGCVHLDSLGAIFLGNFTAPESTATGQKEGGGQMPSSSSSVSLASVASNPLTQVATNKTVRTFLLKEVEKNNLSLSVRNFMTVVRTIVAYTNTTRNSVAAIHDCIPKFVNVMRDSNAIHVIFRESIVGDLADVIHELHDIAQPEESGSQPQQAPSTVIAQVQARHLSTQSSHVPLLVSEAMAAYIVSGVIRAIEIFHGMGIVYRSVQPEAVHVCIDGRICLLDYKHAKVSAVGTRSYTLCGATDYLAPEQITNAGYGAEVDLWAVGVLLFELICGESPFAAASEMAVYKNIAAFGSPKFRSLRFSNDASNAAVELISALLVPDPSKRLGAGIAKNSKQPLKRHEFFTLNHVDWDPAHTRSSTGGVGISKQQSVQQKHMSQLSSASSDSASGAGAVAHQPAGDYYSMQQELAAACVSLHNELTSDGVDVDLVANFSVPYYGTRWDRDLEC